MTHFDEGAYEAARDRGADMDTANKIALGESVKEKKPFKLMKEKKSKGKK